MKLKIQRKVLKNVSWRTLRFWRNEVKDWETVTTAFWKYLLSTKQRELTDEEVKQEPKAEKKTTKKKTSKKSK